jgi:hypothetical protein
MTAPEEKPSAATRKTSMNWLKVKAMKTTIVQVHHLQEKVSLAQRIKAIARRARALALVFHVLKVKMRILISAAVLVIWLFIGAAAIQAFEQPAEEQQFHELEITLATLEDAIGSDLYAEIDAALQSFPSSGSMCNSWPIDTNSSSWDLQGSVFFMFQMVTTIGYGNQAPQTKGGKMFALFYTLLGFVIYGYLSMIMTGCVEGMVFAAVSKVTKVMRIHQHRQAICVFLEASVVLLWIVIMGFYYSSFEDWTFTDSLYFSFISITTIGYVHLVHLVHLISYTLELMYYSSSLASATSYPTSHTSQQ